MKMIWHIMKKDLRAIWPLWAGWLALIAIRIPLLLYYVNSAGAQALSVISLVGGCSLLADVLLVVSLVRALVHEDALVGDNSFWVTRPVAGNQLLVAKLLGASIVCVASPLVLLLPTWLGFGFDQSEIARVLTYHCLLNSILVVLAFLFSVITRRGSSFWLLVISTIVVVVILAIASSQWLSISLSQNDQLAVICIGLVLVLFGVGQQFIKRRAWIVQSTFGACALIAAVILPHLPSFSDDLECGKRIDQPLTISWKSVGAYFAKKEPKSSLPDYVRGDLVVTMPKEYSRIELQLLEGKWISPTGVVDEAIRSDSRGYLNDTPSPRMSSPMQKEGPDAFSCRVGLFLSANWLWNKDQPWTYTSFSGRYKIRFIQKVTVANLKPVIGENARMGSFVTRLISVKAYKGAVKMTSIDAAPSGSPDQKFKLIDPSGIRLLQRNGFSLNSPPLLWVRFTLRDWVYSSPTQEESERKATPRMVDSTRDLLAGGETHENLGDLGWHFTSEIDRTVGYNEYDFKADHIMIDKRE
ncbi:MAG: hypothetical protein QM790_15870 [Nibricoccus sp.]